MTVTIRIPERREKEKEGRLYAIPECQTGVAMELEREKGNELLPIFQRAECESHNDLPLRKPQKIARMLTFCAPG